MSCYTAAVVLLLTHTTAAEFTEEDRTSMSCGWPQPCMSLPLWLCSLMTLPSVFHTAGPHVTFTSFSRLRYTRFIDSSDTADAGCVWVRLLRSVVGRLHLSTEVKNGFPDRKPCHYVKTTATTVDKWVIILENKWLSYWGWLSIGEKWLTRIVWRVYLDVLVKYRIQWQSKYTYSHDVLNS